MKDRRSATVNSSSGASELIRARALEAARDEIRELRESLDEVKNENSRLIDGRKALDEAHKCEISDLS